METRQNEGSVTLALFFLRMALKKVLNWMLSADETGLGEVLCTDQGKVNPATPFEFKKPPYNDHPLTVKARALWDEAMAIMRLMPEKGKRQHYMQQTEVDLMELWRSLSHGCWEEAANWAERAEERVIFSRNDKKLEEAVTRTRQLRKDIQALQVDLAKEIREQDERDCVPWVTKPRE